MLGERAGIPAPERAGSDGSDRRKLCMALYREFEAYYRKSLFSPEGGPAREYLLDQRLLSRKTIDRFGLGFSPSGVPSPVRGASPERVKEMEFFGLIRPIRGGGIRDFMSGRLTIPIRTEHGFPVAFGGRVLGEGTGPKYMNSPEHPFYRKKDVLFGLDQAMEHLEQKRQAIVVEGYFDVIVLSECGLGNVVAPLGTALTSGHLIHLSRLVDDVVLMFDGDRAGRDAMVRLLDRLVFDSRVSVRAVGTPAGMDPDEWIRKEGLPAILERIEKAPPLASYVVSQMEQHLLERPESRDSVLENFEVLVRKVLDPLEQDHLLSVGAGIFGFDKSLLALRILQGGGRGSGEPAAGPEKKERRTNRELTEQNLLVELMRLWGDGGSPHPSEVLSLEDFSFFQGKDHHLVLSGLWASPFATASDIQQLIAGNPALTLAWMALPPGSDGRDGRLSDLVSMVRRLGLQFRHRRGSGMAGA